MSNSVVWNYKCVKLVVSNFCDQICRMDNLICVYYRFTVVIYQISKEFCWYECLFLQKNIRQSVESL